MHVGTYNGLLPVNRVRLTAPATLEKGTGTIQLGVAKSEGKWGIKTINVLSDNLLK